MHNILNISAYRFVPLGDRTALAALREELLPIAQSLALKGTILLAPEGINLFLAGARDSIDAFLQQLRARPAFAGLSVKESLSATQPFGKLCIKLKKEIISVGRTDIDPTHMSAPRVSGAELDAWLDAGQEVVIIDTRNEFEIDYGTFEGAMRLGLSHFRGFAERIESLDPALKDKTIVTFCTGGIRCEKAAPLMLQAGFSKVYQLEGGILKYFEERGASHYQGACYVFDERIALDASLAPIPAQVDTVTNQPHA